MTTALLTHMDCVKHAMSQHPERPARLTSLLDHLDQSRLMSEVETHEAGEVTKDQLNLVHPAEFVDTVESALPSEGLVLLDRDTYMNPDSLRAAKLAAGACVKAVDLVLSGPFDSAFCAVRPPGHHAEIAQAMGFCIFNGIAIAAAVALEKPQIDRVAILDFDVHRCNGTVDIFKHDERVLVCSTFQDLFYPHRYLDFANSHVVISPLHAGEGSQAFRQAVEADWLPAIARHKPDFILISAGFDAHQDDPMAQLNLTTEDFGWITTLIRDLAEHYCDGRIVSTLEGGYDLTALSNSAEAHLSALVS